MTARRIPEISGHLEAALVDRYFCNFSLFQSLPDSWAIDQIFPIMPIHRLNEEPTRRGTIQDVTCDSDGVIDRFAGGRKGKASLELHPWREEEPYILGIFLTGAYQEILGDLHNLFGDTNAVHVRLKDDGLRDHRPGARRHGDRGADLRPVPRQRPAGHLPPQGDPRQPPRRQEANTFIADYVAGLEGYTYLEGELPGGVKKR